MGAHSLRFTGNANGNGTARLNGPATGGAELFHQFNVSTASGGQGTLRFANRNPANLLGHIGAAQARLALGNGTRQVFGAGRVKTRLR